MRRNFIQSRLFFILLTVALFILFYSKGVEAMEKKQRNQKVYFYLVESALKPDELNNIPLSKIVLEKRALFSSEDILKYNSDNHSFLLTDEAYRRVLELKIPVEGRAFVVTIDKKPIYVGAFWSVFSSVSYDGITIMQPINKENEELKIQLGYPKKEFFRGQDHRNNPEILKLLSQKK